MRSALLLLLLTLSFATKAQQLKSPPVFIAEAKLEDCYRVIEADSVLLYYDTEYRLTPPQCASIRRHTRLTADADFKGQVLDYWMETGRLAMRLQYKNAQANGSIEQFHANGTMALRGQLVAGTPTGEWRYWYDNSQLRQVVQFLPDGQLRIESYWDSTGTQRVTDGNGNWEGTLASSYTTLPEGKKVRIVSKFIFRGEVADGVPNGQWQSMQRHNRQPFTIENFVQGKFRSGRLATKPVYGTAALSTPYVVFALESPSKFADGFDLGVSCETRQHQQQDQKILAALRFPTNSLPLPDYAEQLRRSLASYSGQPWYRKLPTETVVRCELDTTGYVKEVSCSNAALKSVILKEVRAMSHWIPATYQGKYIPGGFIVLVSNTRDDVLVELSTMATTPSAAGAPAEEYKQKQGFLINRSVRP
ncbi:toxin-antitoxin system YwqK family antitoxin [Hymenobacter psychrophilus]|uniref:MORN repeat variant n=1 Tax=Hymenobacter psychrophilus TaxID=651662 RepID=A0A1H3FTA7_9BACT|nr:hypothetical protein [Hymenobacter psychrophilus]SDX93369.1 hypothetical protein SAMN04488069_104190 [Hymenobacter psychrophilus]